MVGVYLLTMHDQQLDPYPGNLKHHVVINGGLANGKTLALKQQQKMLNEKCGLYITIVPHGYEIDWIDHKQFLEFSLRKPDPIVQSECRDFGTDVDVDKLIEEIVQLIRSKR